MKKVFVILSYLVASVSIAATAILYPRLPESIPMHWNMHGVIDSYGAKPQAFMMPIISLILIPFLVFIPKIDPKKESYKSFQNYYDILIFAMSLFFLVIQAMILRASFYPAEFQMNNLMPAIIGALFTVIGFLMPKFTHNYFVGIRVPWTLSSPENWEKTHKFAGPVWITGGIITILSGFLFGDYAFFISMAVILVIALVPIIYSYRLFKMNV